MHDIIMYNVTLVCCHWLVNWWKKMWFCATQVADDFMDITSPLKALSDAAVAPFGNLSEIYYHCW